jgi:YbbR domain-containing protein
VKEKDGKKKAGGAKLGWNRLFENNKFVACLSVLLAIVLWCIMAANDTQDHARAITGVPIKITLSDAAQSDGMRVFSHTGGTTATVYVKGNSMVVSQLTSADLVAVIPSAAGITSPGTYTFPLEVRNSDTNLARTQYTVSSISPQLITLTVDRYREKTFTIESDITYKKGYQADPAYFVGTPTLSSDTVTLSGPEKQVSQVNRIAMEYEIGSTLTETKKFTAALVMYDANGNKVEEGDMTVNPEKIDVTIPVLPRRSMDLSPTYTNKPAGLLLESSQVLVAPEKIDVAGPEDTLANMAGSISLDPVDFSTISPSHNSFDATITLPTTCKNLSNSPTAHVTLDLSGMVTRQVNVTTFGVKNVGSGRSAMVDTAVLPVTVVGPVEDLAKLTEASVVGSVDLSGKENFTGRTELPVTFTIGNFSRCWVYGSYMVSVNVVNSGG